MNADGKIPSKNFDDLFLVFGFLFPIFLFFSNVYLPKYTTNFKANENLTYTCQEGNE